MKDFMYIKCHAKGFLGEINIAESTYLTLKNCQKSKNSIFSFNRAGIGKSYIIKTPIIFQF